MVNQKCRKMSKMLTKLKKMRKCYLHFFTIFCFSALFRSFAAFFDFCKIFKLFRTSWKILWRTRSVPDLVSAHNGCGGQKVTQGPRLAESRWVSDRDRQRHGQSETESCRGRLLQTPRLAPTGLGRGRVRQRDGEAFTESGSYLLGRDLKKCLKSSKDRKMQKII